MTTPTMRQELGARLIMEQKHLTMSALALMLEAADRVQEHIDAGASRESAFAREYVPTRMMHRIARKLRLALDVQRGEWIVNA